MEYIPVSLSCSADVVTGSTADVGGWDTGMGEGKLEEEAFVIHWGWVQSFNSSLILILAKEKLVNSLAGFIMDHSFIFNFFFL